VNGYSFSLCNSSIRNYKCDIINFGINLKTKIELINYYILIAYTKLYKCLKKKEGKAKCLFGDFL
jgi:hypothetical protein